VSLGLYLGNDLVKEVATRLRPRLQALPVAEKYATSVIRYRSERFVAYLGKVISVEKEGLFRGASPLNDYRGTFGYVLRVSGQDQGEDEREGSCRHNFVSIRKYQGVA
jgi:hypothetical protein